jgi:hypothetical protein
MPRPRQLCFFALLGAALAMLATALLAPGVSSPLVLGLLPLLAWGWYLLARRWKRAWAGALALLATLTWLWLDPHGWATGVLSIALTLAPLITVAWHIAGRESSAPLRWARRFVASAVLLALPFCLLPHWPGGRDFYLNQIVYRHIAAQAEAANLAPGSCRYFELQWGYALPSLRAVPTERALPMRKAGRVHAYRDKQGALAVALITKDRHHMGIEGYAHGNSTALINRAIDAGCLLGDNTALTALADRWYYFRWD